MKIGDKIKIIEMEGEPIYAGKIGVIKHIDSIGQLHGTWGGLAVNPKIDTIEIVERSEDKIKKCPFCGVKPNPEKIEYISRVEKPYYFYAHFCSGYKDNIGISVTVHGQTIEDVIELWNNRGK